VLRAGASAGELQVPREDERPQQHAGAAGVQELLLEAAVAFDPRQLEVAVGTSGIIAHAHLLRACHLALQVRLIYWLVVY
jgi:hypothetical protein